MNKLIIILSVVVSVAANAQNLRQKHFLLVNGYALSGYDPVSYFQGEPKKGKPTLVYTYNGIPYEFSRPANLEAFRKSPGKYEPAYGGWCAYAMGLNGEKVTVDPKTYRINNGRLYLFYKDIFNNTLNDWLKAETKLQKQADINWTKTYH